MLNQCRESAGEGWEIWVLFFLKINQSGQIITTSAEVTLNGGLVRELPQNPLNSGLGIILICPDKSIDKLQDISLKTSFRGNNNSSQQNSSVWCISRVVNICQCFGAGIRCGSPGRFRRRVLVASATVSCDRKGGLRLVEDE